MVTVFEVELCLWRSQKKTADVFCFPRFFAVDACYDLDNDAHITRTQPIIVEVRSVASSEALLGVLDMCV